MLVLVVDYFQYYFPYIPETIALLQDFHPSFTVSPSIFYGKIWNRRNKPYIIQDFKQDIQRNIENIPCNARWKIVENWVFRMLYELDKVKENIVFKT